MGFFHGIGHAASSAWHWVAKRWKPITAALLAGAAFAAVFALCPPLGPAFLTSFAPSLVPALLAGLAGGATGQLARDLLSGVTPGTDLVKPALLSAGVAAGGMLLGSFAIATPFVARSAPLVKAIATLTGAEAAGSAAGTAAASLRSKLGFVLVNVTPGPEDVIQIVEGPTETGFAKVKEIPKEIPLPPRAPFRGLLHALEAAARDG
jgi:hypothetical protein